MPSTKKSKPSSAGRLCVLLLEQRIDENERELREAVQLERWSHVSGLHGIGTGLWMAKRIVEAELKRASESKPAIRSAVKKAKT